MTRELLTEATARLEAAGVESSRFEAQLLLALALGVSRTQILAGTHSEPTPEQRAEFDRLLNARARRVPLAYLRSTQEFYGLNFEVSPAVLIPRPETELLVEQALLRLRERLRFQESVQIADAGVGSGCIPVAVLANEPRAWAAATDVSPNALAVAGRNARQHDVSDRLGLMRADLFAPLAAETFDVLTSNPPYIPAPEIPNLQPEVRDWEPRLALDGGPDGRELLRRLAPQALRALRSEGWLLLEVASGQAGEVIALLTETGFREAHALNDLAGIPRVVCGRKPQG